MSVEGREYRVKLPIFEGPFDLLLHLVKINEMEITDISLARLTQQYLDYLGMMQEMDLDVAGEFLVVAATLIQIKARYLLPADTEGEEIEEEEIDEILGARELMQQLIEYRSYKEIVARLKDLEEQSSGVFYRHRLPEFVGPDPEDSQVRGDLQALFDAMADVLRYVERREPHTDLYEKYTVEDKFEYIQAKLAESGFIDAVREFERCLNKIEVIVTFLAMLELIRLRRVRLTLKDQCSQIVLYAIDPDTAAPPAPAEETDRHEQATPTEEAQPEECAEGQDGTEAQGPEEGGGDSSADGAGRDSRNDAHDDAGGDEPGSGDSGTSGSHGAAGDAGDGRAEGIGGSADAGGRDAHHRGKRRGKKRRR